MKLMTKCLALLASSLILLACSGGGGGSAQTSEAAPSPGDVLVLTSDNRLVSFDRTNPSAIRTSFPISGIRSGDTLLGMGFYPQNNILYAIARTTPGNGGRIYTIDTSNGNATVFADMVPESGPTSRTPFTTLDPAATAFSVNFNSTFNFSFALISNTGQTLRVFIAPGISTPIGVTYVLDKDTNNTFNFGGMAYTNAFLGGRLARGINIDTVNDNLTIDSLNDNYALVDPTEIAAPLGVNADGIAGFDIDQRTNRGYALLNVGGQVVFHSIAIPARTATLPVSGPAAIPVGAVNIPGFVSMALAPLEAPLVFALDGNMAGTQRLLSFNVRTPNNATATALTGLPAGERLLAIDFRPSNGRMYGLSSAGKLFTIDPDTGTATLASTLSVSADIVNGLALGKNYAMDFNPVAGALRIVSTGEGDNISRNYRVPGTNLESSGTTLTDSNLSLGGSGTGFGVTKIAYSNSFNPAPASTLLFGIDVVNNNFIQQDANAGTLTTLGRATTEVNTIRPHSFGGFDISGGDNGLMLIAMRREPTDPYKLYTVEPAKSSSIREVIGDDFSSIGLGDTRATDIRSLTIRF